MRFILTQRQFYGWKLSQRERNGLIRRSYLLGRSYTRRFYVEARLLTGWLSFISESRRWLQIVGAASDVLCKLSAASN